MDTYQGVCKHCGMVQAVMAESQEIADAIIERKCDCGGYVREGRLMQLQEALKGTVGEDCSIYDLQPLKDDVVDFMHKAGVMVVDNQIQKIAVDVDGVAIKISANAKGVVKVCRGESRRITAEC